MMNILLSPQVRVNDKIWYEIKENKVTATINDVTDTFDFTGMPDGELQVHDEEMNNLIETVLDEVPIIGATKENGVLTVEVLFSIDINEQDERLLFPKPMPLDEFNDLMKELAERDKPEEDESVDDVEEDSDDSLEETDDLVEPDEVADDDIIVEDERVDGEELGHRDDYIIDLEEVDF